MTTVFKYFMFGKYSCLDTNVRGCCMHVFLVSYYCSYKCPVDVLFPISACIICCISCSVFKMLPVQQDLLEMGLPVQITGKILNAHLAIQENTVKFGRKKSPHFGRKSVMLQSAFLNFRRNDTSVLKLHHASNKGWD